MKRALRALGRHCVHDYQLSWFGAKDGMPRPGPADDLSGAGVPRSTDAAAGSDRSFEQPTREACPYALILVRSHIGQVGYVTPVEDTPTAHGEPLGVAPVNATKRFLATCSSCIPSNKKPNGSPTRLGQAAWRVTSP